MKKFALIIGLLTIMFSASGCQKMSYEFNIDKKGNIEIVETQAINLNAMSQMMGDFTSGMAESVGETVASSYIQQQINENFEQGMKETKAELEKEGYQVSEYKDDTYRGLTRVKNYKISNFGYTSLPAGFTTNNRPVVQTQNLFARDIYSINLTYDFAKAAEENSMDKHGNTKQDNEPKVVSEESYIDEETGQNMTKKVYDNGMTVTSTAAQNPMASFGTENMSEEEKEALEKIMPIAELKIKIPSKALSHNATEVLEGNVYKWKLSIDKPTEIELEYRVVDTATLGITISMFVLLLLVLVAYKIIKND